MYGKTANFLLLRARAIQSYAERLKAINAASLRGVWMLDEPSGGTAIDGSGNGRDGTYTGTSIITAPDGGNARSFDGITDQVLVSHHTSLNPTTALTVSAWMNPTTIVTYGGLAQKGAYGTGGYGLYTVNAGSGIRGWIEAYGPYGVQPGGVTTSTWQHIALRYDGSKLQIYQNGVMTSDLLSVPASITATTDDLYLGRTEGGGYFHGGLWGVALWTSALSEAQITALATL